MPPADDGKVAVHLWDGDEGLVILNPANVRAMSDEELTRFIEWAADTQERMLRPRSCPFCGVPT